MPEIQNRGRRALIEQAKGILMARHSINADRAFEMLRDHSPIRTTPRSISRSPIRAGTCVRRRRGEL